MQIFLALLQIAKCKQSSINLKTLRNHIKKDSEYMPDSTQVLLE